MTNTLAQGQALMKSSAQRYHAGDSWEGWCAAWAYRFVGGDLSADTAWKAYQASGWNVTTSHSVAPKGAIGYWSGAGGDGHVAVCQGNDRWGMASGAVTTRWGVDQGTILFNDYARLRPGMTWVGWTVDYVGAMVQDAVFLIKRAGHDEIYRIVDPKTAVHLTPAQYAPLKAAGHNWVSVTSATLDKFLS